MMSLEDAVIGFFTSGVKLRTCPLDLPAGHLWWEERQGWRYPWRLIGIEDGVMQGYPCGEPERIVRKVNP